MKLSSPRTPVARTVAVGAAVAALLTGCSVPGKVQTPVESAQPPGDAAPAVGGAPEGFEDYYDQSLEWAGCGDGLECATVSAPLSWHDPQAGSIELALNRYTARGEKVGSLLVNPGGPGGSGVDFLASAITGFGDPLKQAFDIVGFDPRGVGASTPVTCFDDARKDESLSKDFDLETDEGVAAAREEARAWAEACAENTGELLGHVDTQSAARDMDMLRAVLGDEQLHYLGYSYGTQLGATYAGLFPERAGRLVLDGGIDPTLSADETSKGQAVGFENALRAYVTDCMAGDSCPLTGSVDDGMHQVRRVLDNALERPYPTSSDRDVTQTLAFFGIAVTLYDEGSWPVLTQALEEVLTMGTADVLLYLADFYNDRNSDGTFSTNSAEAFRAVGCLDDRGSADVEEMRAQVAEIEEVAPTVGTFFGYGAILCADWPYPEVEQQFDVTAAGADPILVVGTTNDPATPYVWSEGLADTLSSGVLLTYEGEGHTAYGRSNECVADAVERYLVEGTVPDDGTTC